MTPSERKLFNAVERRSRDLTPELAAAMLRAWARVRDSLTEAALARAIALGFAESIVEQVITQAILDVALAPMRMRLREAIRVAVPYYAKTLPPKVGEIGIAFDVLSPNVIDAIRTLDTRVLTQFSTDVREAVREAVAIGLERGQSTRAVAKGLRDVIGLAANQVREVEAFRVKLEHAHERLDALDNKLRDKRFDAAIRKARASGEPIPAERIDRMVDAYRKRRIAQNAAINARQAAVESQKLANRLAWQSAVDGGANVVKKWSGVLDERERDTHVKMEGVTVPFDQPWVLPDGKVQMTPGAGEFGCRCVAIYRVAA